MAMTQEGSRTNFQISFFTAIEQQLGLKLKV